MSLDCAAFVSLVHAAPWLIEVSLDAACFQHRLSATTRCTTATPTPPMIPESCALRLTWSTTTRRGCRQRRLTQFSCTPRSATMWPADWERDYVNVSCWGSTALWTLWTLGRTLSTGRLGSANPLRHHGPLWPWLQLGLSLDGRAVCQQGSPCLL